MNRHDHQQVYVAVRAGLTASKGAEENDLVRVELLDNPPYHFGDDLLGSLSL
jgi:hypothetical protein